MSKTFSVRHDERSKSIAVYVGHCLCHFILKQADTFSRQELVVEPQSHIVQLYTFDAPTFAALKTLVSCEIEVYNVECSLHKWHREVAIAYASM